MPNPRDHHASRRSWIPHAPRRLGAAIAAAALVALVGSPAAAEDAGTTTPTPEAGPTNTNLGPQTEGTPVCVVNNQNLSDASGIVAGTGGIYVIEGGNASQVEVWTIVDPGVPAAGAAAGPCQVSSQRYALQPLDPQGVALDAQGILWVADVGNLNNNRQWLTFERVDLASGGTPDAYRARQPASGQISGVGVLWGRDGLPLVLANGPSGAELYKPDGAMTANSTDIATMPTLVKVADVAPQQTGTSTPRDAFGRRLFTDAAISPDGGHVVLRTEADAYEFTVGADGDIAAALTRDPVITPLPMEEEGTGITYSSDNARFLTITAGRDPILRSYQRYTPPLPSLSAGSGGAAGGFDLDDITTIASVTGFLGLAALIAGVVGMVRFRRRQDEDEEYDDYDRPRGGRAPRPRPGYDEGPRGRPGRAPARVGPGGDDHGRDDYGRDGPGRDDYGSQRGTRPRPAGHGPDHGYGPGGADPGYGGGQPYGQPAQGQGGGQVYGGGPGGGQVYGGQQGGGQQGGGQPGGGQVYGRPRRPYGNDNIDV